MRVLRIKPGRLPEAVDVPNELEALQKEVEGWIECLTLEDDIVVICNDEGAINGSEFNVYVNGHYLFGTILIAGVCGEEFCDIPDDAEAAYIAAWGVTKAACDKYREARC